MNRHLLICDADSVYKKIQQFKSDVMIEDTLTNR